MAAKRIVIIGGGFAGVKCAEVLRSKLRPSDYEIVLFNRENHMVFHPLLAEVVGASLSPSDIAAPLRRVLPKVKCRTEDVLSVDLANSRVEFEGEDSRARFLEYSHLVLACGSIANLSTVPGMADHAFPLKTIGDAIALRAHVLRQLEKADVCDDPERKKQYLSFIVVGGGFSGVEVAGEINDLARSSAHIFSSIEKSEIQVTVVHSQPQVLPEMSPTLRDFALEKMKKAGINVILNRRAKLATANGVRLDNDDRVRGGTIVCTVGTSMSPIVERLKVEKDKGRMITESDMRLVGSTNAWAIGDCARIPNAFDNQLSPPTGQFAERQGRQVALNIIRSLRNEPTQPFSHRPLGQLCSIGGHVGVAEMFGLHFSGFVAWFIWRGVYLFKLPSWSRRVKVGFDWAFNLLFFRDLTHFRVNQTERVSRAYFQPGDYVFCQGDPATNFYVIEKGEVEVLRKHVPDGSEELVAVLGEGSFFGEMALINNQPRSASIRAKTAVEAIVLGRNVFTQVSRALAPLRRVLTDAVNQRSGRNWQNQPMVREALGQISVLDITTQTGQIFVRPDQTLADVLALFDQYHPDFCLVSPDKSRLDGILTRTELLRALEMSLGRGALVQDFMRKDPIVVMATETALGAADLMRENSVSWLPVITDKTERRLKGVVRAQSFVTQVLKATGMGTTP